tara:strand:+ start:124 stop:1323 length:1200 start_codon:yes stop_codon:yes gene_type:complete
MAKFTGLGSNFYTGVVEDRNDPLSVGRVRVRIYGLHTDDKTLIASSDLPWSDVLMPTTAPSLSGLGMSPHGLVEGSTVMGFFRDEDDMQDFVVMGSLFGFPTQDYRIETKNSGKNTTKERSAKYGFNDPRLPEKKENAGLGLGLAGQNDVTYSGTPEGTDSDSGKNWTLLGNLDTSPVGRPTELKVATSGSGMLDSITSAIGITDGVVNGQGVEIVNAERGINYPREFYTEDGLSDVNQNAITGGSSTYPNNLIQKHQGNTVKEDYDRGLAPKYPYNHMIESEGGHIIEMDDTPSHERLHVYHRSGSRLEFMPKGDAVMKVMNNSYEVILKDKKILIAGSADIELANGNYNLIARKGKSENSDGTISLTADGNIDLTLTDKSKAVRIKGNMSLNGTKYD